ncbi:phage tail sheath subtilisin-like domain-containing protein [Micromonospora sp. WMMA1363]|uniref:phage tail sheath family protein n=1 Tax=Micromonospora sp. WMMA1363 TaxID=3053985 RepID=UPI00259D2038|nr:phage tail sheath subtilisin-like domain-containing protein [Micromonospora sp. WMMA1363]MDM4722264.1 phage tail sheath subtilisin-like domain-containing protein [Micromonospora sp. WMMA1363]
MPDYFSPGIYVEEVPSGARPIGPVGTSTAAFVGIAPDRSAHVNRAIPVNNWSEFLRLYASGDHPRGTALSQAVYGYMDNGGRRCWVVNVGEDGQVTGTGTGRAGLELLEPIDEISIVAAPGFSDPVSHEALLALAEKTRTMVAICDPPLKVNDISALTRVGTASSTPATRPAGTKPPGDAGSRPDPDPTDSEGSPSRAPASRSSAVTSGSAGDGEEETVAEPAAYRPRQSDFGTFYFPWLLVRDPIGGKLVYVPPSGHVAGIWARTDAQRGVHKAPANEPVRGAVDLAHRVTRSEQDVLNPKGVDVIRFFPDEGIRVWGARTLAAEASEFRYLNVRRLTIEIEQSIARGTRWMVFEPNDSTLWRSIRRDIGAFLTRVWRDGALLGRTPEEAFFVKCDEETNPADVRDAGMVVALIGIAVVKPAEFVVFKLSQWPGGTETETTGG